MIVSGVHRLCDVLGRRLRALYRVCYMHQDEIESQGGDLTLIFDPNTCFRFHSTESGYGVEIESSRWAGSVDTGVHATTRQSMEGYGSYAEVCLNASEEWAYYVGSRLTSVGQLIYRLHGEIAGVSLHFDAGHGLYVYDIADELIVQKSIAPDEFSERIACEIPPRS